MYADYPPTRWTPPLGDLVSSWYTHLEGSLYHAAPLLRTQSCQVVRTGTLW